ncbi:MAG: hypothetical protein GF308_21830 [Candidatus Heimdallarchaeota archaeon]|nr:hypothetical protein [Candidatus Heimdallarchaeota archaeon]
MAEKTIKISDEIYNYLDSLRKEHETVEDVLERLITPRDSSITIDDAFGKWIGSNEEFAIIQKTIASSWKSWNDSLQSME